MAVARQLRHNVLIAGVAWSKIDATRNESLGRCWITLRCRSIEQAVAALGEALMSHILIVLLATVGQAEVPPSRTEPPSGAQIRAERMAYMRKKVAEYRLFLGAESRHELKLKLEPVYRWTWLIRDIPDGATFVWTCDGRPEAVTQVFLQTKPKHQWIHSFSSLSEEPLRAEHDEKSIWSPTKGGVKLERVPGAPTPATSPVLRRRQMRSILDTLDASVDLGGQGAYQLREVPRPIIRYADSESNIIDGAIFTLSEGTNPKLLLILEARGPASGNWHYAIAPVTIHKAKASLAKTEVFRVPLRWPPNDPKATLFNRTFAVDTTILP